METNKKILKGLKRRSKKSITTIEVNKFYITDTLYVVETIKAGERLTKNNVRSVRPGFGMHPKFYNDILNKKAMVDLEKGTALKMSFIENNG